MGVKDAAGAKRKAPVGRSGPGGSSKKARIQKADRMDVDGESDPASDSDSDMDDFSSDSDDGGVKLTPAPKEKGKKKEHKTEKNGDKNGEKKAEKKNGASNSEMGGGETSREAHAKQKQLARERKAAKPLADELARTKKIWEQLRRKSHVPKDERKKLVEELFSIITGRMKDFVLKHDAVRAVQTAVKYATPEQRKLIAKELQGAYSQLAESRYAKFLIGKLMVATDDEIRDIIISEFYGRVRRLINHPEASWIVDDIYRSAATKQQKAMLLREWYGAEFALLEKTKAQDATADLAQILEAEPAKRGPIMKSLWDMINSLVQKKMTGFTMLHDAMFQYFKNVTRDSSEYNEFYELVKADETGDLLKNMAFTRRGSHLAALLLANGTAKDRKQILKTYKDTFAMMAGDQYAHIVILTACDVIDDTKMTAKAIFPELLGETAEQAGDALLESASNPNARATILYLLEGPSKALFSGQLSEDLEILKEIHEIRKTTSKKEAAIRTQELVAAMSPQLLAGVVQAAPGLVADSFGCQIMTEIMFSAVGDKAAALEAIAANAAGDPSVVVEPVPEGEEVVGVDPVLPHISQTPHGGKLLKSLTAGGKFDRLLGKVKPVEPALGFADVLYPVIEEHLVAWATGPSSFIVVNMLDSETFEGRKKAEATLKKRIGELEAAAGEVPSEKEKKKAAKKGDKKGAATEKKGAAAAEKKSSGNQGSRLLLARLR
ncbi:related to PUF6 Member of the PUF protein family [Cephalotrichum gorgonifer]|uniref:Related to PUF6 Member of the PUF protein family n=1 Tax=Cephalotrichum gorgonifer TaxID=2041049 RepID=A0AAE8MQ49_9PEZI|nr:related to PUF6 Member of the PUF protein family [Cephalotrichum gorgonifer]